jgi:hypothetical protein
MQNISAVLKGIGCPRISGYQPARNVGTGVTAQILASLAELNPSVPDLFQPLPAAARQPPVGEVAPQKNLVTSTAYQRGAAVVVWVRAAFAVHHQERCALSGSAPRPATIRRGERIPPPTRSPSAPTATGKRIAASGRTRCKRGCSNLLGLLNSWLQLAPASSRAFYARCA